MVKIVIYTDFDGTITGKPGNAIVFKDFYQSLLMGYKNDVKQDYKSTPMKDIHQILYLFEEKFGSYDQSFNFQQEDSNFLMSSEAVTFFHAIFENPDVEINIITRNRAEYIIALFTYQGFTTEEINRLSIMESGFKHDDVAMNLQSQKESPGYIYILDDSVADFEEMMKAAKLVGYNSEQIRGYRKDPGEFEWIKYLQDIKEFCGIESYSQSEKTLGQPSEIHIQQSTNSNRIFTPVISVSANTNKEMDQGLEPNPKKTFS